MIQFNSDDPDDDDDDDDNQPDDDDDDDQPKDDDDDYDQPDDDGDNDDDPDNDGDDDQPDDDDDEDDSEDDDDEEEDDSDGEDDDQEEEEDLHSFAEAIWITLPRLSGAWQQEVELQEPAHPDLLVWLVKPGWEAKPSAGKALWLRQQSHCEAQVDPAGPSSGLEMAEIELFIKVRRIWVIIRLKMKITLL